jgi:hypothetical protein
MDAINTIINELYKNELITVLGTFASVLSFFMTLYVIITISRIRRFYIFIARVPEINDRLIKFASEISSQLNSFTGINTTIVKLLADVEVDLASMSRKVDGPLKKRIKLVVEEIDLMDGRKTINKKIINFFESNKSNNILNTPEKSLQNIYFSLYKLTKECAERYEDARWEQ